MASAPGQVMGYAVGGEYRKPPSGIPSVYNQAPQISGGAPYPQIQAPQVSPPATPSRSASDAAYGNVPANLRSAYLSGSFTPSGGGGTSTSAPAFSASGTNSASLSSPNINIAAPPPLTNTATDNADTRYLIDRLKQQTTGPGTSNAAIQQAGQAIGQFAEGGRNQLRDSLSRRGMLGTSGAEDALGGEITNRAQQQFGQAASNIALGRQNQIDQTLLGAQGIFAEPGRQQLGQQGLGLQQWQAQVGANQGAAGLQLQQQALQNQAAQQQYQAQLQQQQLALQQLATMQNTYSNLYA